ncbi:hypothetical protein [Muriicola soli]|uniref:Uncharacterized protein n=1 Tax=Muriicola soli TaxID=2507538 RepID=A0A411EAN5_9FLAO|nr:hypothetical protein [Muriicola soli]QBA64785.1 hypothetical protein EQY75_09750 [Muriicola soli]
MKALLIISFLLSCLIGVAQDKEYLTIELEGGQKNEVSYPPGTEYYLFDKQGNFVLAEGDLNEPFVINSQHTLIVSPKYKKDTDKFVIRAGRILMKELEVTDSSVSDSGQNDNYNGQLTVRKEYFDSNLQGQRNLLLVFNNGLVFRYFDGEARAWYNNDEVTVEGEFLVEIPEGTAKISYNPFSGETWWVIDDSENNK